LTYDSTFSNWFSNDLTGDNCMSTLQQADFYRFLPQALLHLPQITVGSGLDHLRISPR